MTDVASMAAGQSERADRAEAQWQATSRLRQVLQAWGHGPEFIESLLSWGFRIETEATEARLAKAERLLG